MFKYTSDAQHWGAYHHNVGTSATDSAGYKMKLNSTDAKNNDDAFLGDTAPDATNINLGSSSWVNRNTGLLMAICFKSIKGFSKFGGYRGNGSATEGFYQPLGFSPSLVIVKKTSATAAWYMWNGVYQGYNPKNNALFPYHTSQQNTTERIELLSNGFKFYHSDSDHNASSTDFIYYAWASNPIVGSNGTAGVAK